MANLKNLIQIGTPRDKQFFTGLVVSALQAVSAAGLLATSGWLISRAAQQPPVLYLMIAVVMVRGFALGRAFFRYLERILLHDATLNLQATVRPRVFTAIIPFSIGGSSKKSNSDAISGVVADVEELQNLPTRIISPIVQSIAVSIAAILATAVLVPAASIVLLIAVLATGFVIAPFATSLSAKQAASVGELKNQLARETMNLVQNLAVAKAFGWQQHLADQIAVLEAKLAAKVKRLAFSQGLANSLLAAASTVATAVIALIAADAFNNSKLAAVNIAVIALLPLAVFDTLQSLLPVGSAWLSYRKAALRTLETLGREIPAELAPIAGQQVINGFESLKLSAVSITYPGTKKVAVSNFDLELLPGETVALCGESGAGKSTVARAMLGQLRIKDGSYRINSFNASEIANLNSVIGYLEQTPTIFMGSVRDNLLLAKPNADDDELLKMLEKVGLKTMFEARQSLDTQLGELGAMISGGEAQRLAMARLLLAKFSVLILDEPTANVDVETADRLMKDLLALATSDTRAVLLITHQSNYQALAKRQVVIK